MNMTQAIEIDGVSKAFTMHLQGGIRLPVFRDVSFCVAPGECVVLGGPSGTGKSSLLKIIYGSYRCDSGRIRVQRSGELIDMAAAVPRRIIGLRRDTIGYVSQFLRVIPRVGAIEIVSAAALEAGWPKPAAREHARSLMKRLNLPERLWDLPPATFSGGEQQRVNIARGFAGRHCVLLLDEPTASLDAANRAVVVELIKEKKAAGVALIGVFHDDDVRQRVADRVIDVTKFAPEA